MPQKLTASITPELSAFLQHEDVADRTGWTGNDFCQASKERNRLMQQAAIAGALSDGDCVEVEMPEVQSVSTSVSAVVGRSVVVGTLRALDDGDFKVLDERGNFIASVCLNMIFPAGLPLCGARIVAKLLPAEAAAVAAPASALPALPDATKQIAFAESVQQETVTSGTLLRAALRRQGLSLAAFCREVEKLGGAPLPYDTAQSWLSGRNPISPAALALVALMERAPEAWKDT